MYNIVFVIIISVQKTLEIAKVGCFILKQKLTYDNHKCYMLIVW